MEWREMDEVRGQTRSRLHKGEVGGVVSTLVDRREGEEDSEGNRGNVWNEVDCRRGERRVAKVGEE